ncbi:MAG: YceI family protein, partial [Anaerolineae bacterium]|nr:YceI family protein [Anaerolineae bacterium]
VPLVVETTEPAAVATSAPELTATAVPEPTATVVPDPTATEETQPVVEPVAEATVAEVQPTETPAEATTETASGPMIFEIVPAESQARFAINEVLRGSPKTVIGATDQVSGQLAVDPSDPAATQVGVIQVNARTLATDSNMRDRALKNWILQTNDYEFVTFEPSEVLSMPASVAVGESFSFQLAGNLTVRDTTVPVTFDVTVTPVSETRLEGMATLTIPYQDLNVSIPDSPSVDTVSDDLTLELEFVAIPAGDV